MGLTEGHLEFFLSGSVSSVKRANKNSKQTKRCQVTLFEGMFWVHYKQFAVNYH